MAQSAQSGRRTLRVLETLRTALEQGTYPVGSKLPTERTLAEEFGVSRPTIRKAVARLVDEGRIRTRHGSGMVVCDPKLAAGRTGTISVMYEFDEARLRRVQEFLLRRGFMPCAFSVAERQFDPEVEKLFLQRALAEKHYAVLAFCSPLQPVNTDALDALAAAGTRVVHVEPFRLTRPDQEYLLPDYEAAGRMAGDRLRAFGCTKFVCVRMTVSPFEMLLERGFQSVIADADGFLFPPNVEGHHPAREKVVAFLKQLPEGAGLFCRSLDIAQSLHALANQYVAAKGLRVLGVSMWGEVAHLPFEYLAFDRQGLLMQALTHVAQPGFQAIRQAVPPTLIPRTEEASKRV